MNFDVVPQAEALRHRGNNGGVGSIYAPLIETLLSTVGTGTVVRMTLAQIRELGYRGSRSGLLDTFSTLDNFRVRVRNSKPMEKHLREYNFKSRTDVPNEMIYMWMEKR